MINFVGRFNTFFFKGFQGISLKFVKEKRVSDWFDSLLVKFNAHQEPFERQDQGRSEIGVVLNASCIYLKVAEILLNHETVQLGLILVLLNRRLFHAMKLIFVILLDVSYNRL